MVLMQFEFNPNCTSTNSEHVCNMDNHFKDNINLPNSHPCVFMIKTPLEGTSYGTPPLKIQNSIVLTLFFMVLMQFRLRNANCINTNYEHVYNMDSHFKDNINLLNFHPCVLCFYLTWINPFSGCF